MCQHGSRGRPQKPYQTPDKRTIEGLARGNDGRWRIIATGERFREADWRKAVARFRAWQAKNEPSPNVTLGTTYAGNAQADTLVEFLNTLPAEASEALLAGNVTTVIDGASVVATLPCPAGVLWPWLTTMLIDHPEYIARMTGVEEVARLGELPHHAKPIAIDTLIERYRKNSPALGKTKITALKYVVRLVTHLGLTRPATLADLTTEALLAFQSHVEATIPGAATRSNIYTAIRTVINFGSKVGLDAGQIAGALQRCKVLWTSQAKPEPTPMPISRPDYHILLAKATGKHEKWRVWLLLGLNMCMSMSEVCNLRWTSETADGKSTRPTFDLEHGTYSAIRDKTKRKHIPRAATLWPETMAELKKIEITDNPYVLRSRRGTKYNSNGQVAAFTKFAKSAGLSVTYNQLRDGAYTAAMHGAPDARWARVLAGHKADGLEANYVLINAAYTRPACEAVHKAYFGNATAG